MTTEFIVTSVIVWTFQDGEHIIVLSQPLSHAVPTEHLPRMLFSLFFNPKRDTLPIYSFSQHSVDTYELLPCTRN